MGEAASQLAYPLIECSRGHLVIVYDETQLRRCTRAGVRAGWYDGLVIVDSALRRWPVTLLQTRADGVFGWLTGRLVADLELGEPGTVDLDDVRQHVIDVLQGHAAYWDADGQLDARLHAMRRAHDLQQLIDALRTDDP